MKRLAILACAAWAAAHAAEPVKSIAVAAALEPGRVHEECMRLESGEQRRYHWKATGPVDFNIHFHRGNDVTYPVKREGMRGDGGAFTAKSGEDYCWMWTARDKAVKVEGLIASK